MSDNPPADLEALALRCEQADGPSRELDGEIWCALFGCTFEATDASGFSFSDRDGVGPCWQQRIDYTTSIDAALTLVPEGLMVTVSQHDHGKGAASIFRRNEDGERVTCCKLCVAATPALALCAAALRATLAEREASHG